jgi:L-threonylcarbamoyladenylate synthase
MAGVCVEIPPLAWLCAERFWPGALSLVLERASVVPDEVTAGGPTVAVRVPDHSLIRDLVHRLGAPLAATSANLHAQPAPVEADGVYAALGRRISLILDGGRCEGGVSSTVLDLTVSPPAILRPGPVTVEHLASLVDLREGDLGDA